MEVINTIFLFFTWLLREFKDIWKVLLTKRHLCLSAKFIISNNTINKIEIPPQIPPKILPGRFSSVTENNSYLLKADTTHFHHQPSKGTALCLTKVWAFILLFVKQGDTGQLQVKNNKIKIFRNSFADKKLTLK